MEREGIKPCPCCGCGADLVYDVFNDLWKVQCLCCGLATMSKENSDDVVRMWNKRKPKRKKGAK